MAALDLSALAHRTSKASVAEALRKQDASSVGLCQFSLPPVQNVSIATAFLLAYKSPADPLAT